MFRNQGSMTEQCRVFLLAMKNEDGRSTEERLVQAAREYCKRTGKEFLAEEEWSVVRSEKGKPCFDKHPEVQFSVSHSGDWWICAMGDVQVGIDLQEHALLRNETKEQAIIRLKKLARRFFHPTEAAYVDGEAHDFQRFFRVWAARESYVKYTGQGIDAGFSEHCLIPEGFEKEESREWKAQNVWLREVPFQAEYTLCVCTSQLYRIEEIVIYV